MDKIYGVGIGEGLISRGIDFRRESRFLVYIEKCKYSVIIKREQVQTLSAVSVIDLGRMSPCSLLKYGTTDSKTYCSTAKYADVFVPQNKRRFYDYMWC